MRVAEELMAVPKKKRERRKKADILNAKLAAANIALSYVINQLAGLDNGQRLFVLDAVKVYYRLDKMEAMDNGE